MDEFSENISDYDDIDSNSDISPTKNVKTETQSSSDTLHGIIQNLSPVKTKKNNESVKWFNFDFQHSSCGSFKRALSYDVQEFRDDCQKYESFLKHNIITNEDDLLIKKRKTKLSESSEKLEYKEIATKKIPEATLLSISEAKKNIGAIVTVDCYVDIDNASSFNCYDRRGNLTTKTELTINDNTTAIKALFSERVIRGVK